MSQFLRVFLPTLVYSASQSQYTPDNYISQKPQVQTGLGHSVGYGPENTQQNGDASIWVLESQHHGGLSHMIGIRPDTQQRLETQTTERNTIRQLDPESQQSILGRESEG